MTATLQALAEVLTVFTVLVWLVFLAAGPPSIVLCWVEWIFRSDECN